MRMYPVLGRSIAELQEAMAAGEVTSLELCAAYLSRIERLDRSGPCLNSVLELNGDAMAIAESLDREQAAEGRRGLLHGIPILLKDNIDTGDRMTTSAGSLALSDHAAERDAFLVQRLREAGAVILGKTNMTEWAHYMSKDMAAGYSSKGGRTRNPHGPDRLDPGGSSSGSAVGVAVGFAAASIGTETSGSILSPASYNAIVGVKPTVGLISRSGIIPLAPSQDTPGPMAHTVADAALLLSVLAGADPFDPASASAKWHASRDYRKFLYRDGLQGARIGVPRKTFVDKLDAEEAKLWEYILESLRKLGAELADPAELPSAEELSGFQSSVFKYEFKPAINAYLRRRPAWAGIRSLRDVIAYNERNASRMLKYGQSYLLESDATSGTLTEPAYIRDRMTDLRLSRSEGIDAALAKHRLDALVFPGHHGASVAAKAGYPSVTVPAGLTEQGKPLGLTFTGPAFSEGLLLKLAYSFEQQSEHKKPVVNFGE